MAVTGVFESPLANRTDFFDGEVNSDREVLL